MTKDTLLKGWNYMRWLSLGIGLLMTIQGIKMQESLSGILGILFLYQAITNTGCCGSNGCINNSTSSDHYKNKKIEYKEVKTK